MTERKIILVVENQADIRTLIRMALEIGPYLVQEIDNGAVAWDLVRAIRPSLILLDAATPGIPDAYQLCRKVKADGGLRDIPLVMLGARHQAGGLLLAKQAGADAYLSKPFSPLELICTADRLLRQPQQLAA